MELEDKEENAVEKLYKQEFELLKGMFEDHFSSEVIAGVLEDCAGDVNHAVDTLTKIDGSGAVDSPLENPPNIESRSSAVTECYNNNTTQTSVDMSCTTHSYASASQASEKAPKIIQPRRKNIMPKIDYWTEQMRKILKDYNEGTRVMVIMRGAPGSGKTYLARVIIESTVGTKNFNNYSNHIFSADDHMEINGVYSYNINRLDEVHMKNQSRVHKAVNEGRSPVIIDNTNMKTWEMFAYARDAVANGYIIEVLEPSNPWSKNPSQLAKRNIHGVPKEKIQTMFQKYEGGHDGESLIKCFKLVYPKGMVPPVKRNIPPFHERSLILVLPPGNIQYLAEPSVNQPNHVHEINNLESQQRDLQEVQDDNHNTNEIPATLNVNDISQIVESNNSVNQTQIPQHQTMNDEKNLDEILKVEVEWENGGVWETPSANHETKMNIPSLPSPKPQRSKANKFTTTLEKYIEPSMLYDDWSKNLKFMTPMQDTASALEEPLIQLQTKTTRTPVENGDSITEEHRTISTIQANVTPNHSKITIKREASITGRCEHEEKHFVQMRKMFKNIPRPVLREIFDNCEGDVYWACSIVLDGIKHNNLETLKTQESDSEEEVEEVDCQCQNNQACFSLMPDKPTTTLLSTPDENTSSVSTPMILKKTKKEKIVTDDSIQLKRQIEKSIMISDYHYSQHYLNTRRPCQDNKSPDSEKITPNNNESPSNNQTVIPETADLIDLTTSVQSSSTPLAHVYLELCVLPEPDTSQNVLRDMPSTSSANANDAIPSTSGTGKFESKEADDEDDDVDDCDNDYDTLGSDNDKPIKIESKNVTLNIGMQFVRRLDELYGRHDFEYPKEVEAVMSIPTKILHELNAIWMESITYQLDNNHTQTEEMIKQDEEFARQVEIELQLEAEAENFPEEEENAQSCEPQKPSEPKKFKEIMDTELALAIYEKEVKEEWKNKEPQDMAAQMTRKKLYELFPDVANETLSEMLIAHDNSFENTVETLMMSTGQGHFLDQINGINKFVMVKEKENKDKLMLAEQNAALNEEEYPYLFKPGKQQTELSMDTVNQMREKAEMHKNARDMYFQKAQWYYARKKLAEASHYSRIAALHTARYDTANNYAAAALVQYHAHFHPDSNVIDLHFLRVPEAETSLDLFIDDRLRKMRLSPNPKPLVLHIITGRGKHSPGRPRVKPAIMNRLRIRGLTYRHQNPGLLEARLHPTHMLLEELLNS